MSVIYIPCLNVDAPDNGGGLSVGVGVGLGSGGDGTVPAPGISISHDDSPITITIIPVFPYILPGINWQFWADLFGLGETRIQREKEQIQDVYTPIFRYVKEAYGFPLRDNHALQMSSEYVEQMFREDPFKAQSASGMYQSALPLAQSVFVDDTPSEGQRKRIVNQFLANAHINEWPTNAWVVLWNGILQAADPQCRNDQSRFMRNPMLIEAVAKYSVLLQYMPLANFAGAVAESKFNDRNGKRVMRLWLQDPRLVEGIVTQQPYPDWAVPYESTGADGQPPSNPYASQQIADREPIQALWQGIRFQRPWYPDLIKTSDGGLPDSVVEIPPAEPPETEPGEPVPPPFPDGNQTDVPPREQEPTPWPQNPDCPPYQPPDEDPDDQSPNEPPPDPQTGCPQPCQEQIDYALDRLRFIDNWLNLGLVPRLDNLEEWSRDLERRVPGPLPPLPYPTPLPPWLPPEEIPTDPGDEIPPTDGGTGEEPEEPLFDPECAEKLRQLCDDTVFCQKVAACDRELECRDLTLCDDAGGPWGGMAECWLDKNTPAPLDVQGVYRERQYPNYAVDTLLFCYAKTTQTMGGGQGQGGGIPLPFSEQSPQADMYRFAQPYLAQVLAAYQRQPIEALSKEDLFQEPIPYIYQDPTASELPSLQVITVKPRAGEIDPCTGVAEEVVEIPPAGAQP